MNPLRGEVRAQRLDEKGHEMEFLIVFLGGGLGAAGRHGVNILASRFLGSSFPAGTLCINVLGSFLMGVVVEYFALRSGLSQQLRLFLATGILGGFTTFSTFSLEAALLHERGEQTIAIVYVVASVVLGIGAFFAATRLIRALM